MISAPLTAKKAGRGKRAARRSVVVVIGLFTVWHVFATFLWVAPVTPIRKLVPGNLLESYMIPFYGQSWSVFAPEPINGNYAFKVRAGWAQKDGTEVVTPWVDATAAETMLSRDNLFPPRAASLAVQEADQFKGAFDSLSADAQIIAGLNYMVGADWRTRLESKMRSYGNDIPVTAYMNEEYYAAAYSTQVAKALWGSEPTKIQFQISRTNIPTFIDRKNPAAVPNPAQIANTGWRPLVVLPGQSQQHFADIFVAARLKADHEK